MPKEYQGPSFLDRLKAKQAAEGVTPEPEVKKKHEPQPEGFEIPELYEATESDKFIDGVLDRINILEAYNKWCGKEVDAQTINRREGIMVSCPKPNHRDSHPSAWLNIDKGTWFCGGCQEGGDMFDIAAYAKSFPVPGYKEGTHFRKLREEMAADFGAHIKRVAGFEEVPYADEDSKAAETLPDNSSVSSQVEDSTSSDLAEKGPKSSEQALAIDPDGGEVEKDNVIPIPVAEDTSAPVVPPSYYPTIDWQKIIPEDTFLYEYLKACSIDTSAEEYHFWNGMLAIGHAAGRKVVLDDEPVVLGNLFLVILGGTGKGKSKSRRHLNYLMNQVFPFENHGFFTTGVNTPPVPGSGESLVSMFTHVAEDPMQLSNPKKQLNEPVYTSVNGMVEFDEFSGIMRRVNRQGSTLEDTLQKFADGAEVVSVKSQTSGTTKAVQPFCSITASSQPTALRGLIKKENASSGFLNRWIFAAGREKKQYAFTKTKVNLDRPLDKLKELKSFCQNEREITIDNEAMDAIERFFQNTIFPKKKQDESDLLQRLDLIMKKLMLLFAINERSAEVTLDIWERVVPLFDYIVECYDLVSAEIGVTQSWEIGKRIMAAVENFEAKHKKGPTARDIERSIASQKYSPEQIKRALEALVATDRLVLVKPPIQRGRPRISYEVAK